MVYIHLPENLTEEEQMLMAKYAKLKKKVCLFEIEFLFCVCLFLSLLLILILFVEETSASS